MDNEYENVGTAKGRVHSSQLNPQWWSSDMTELQEAARAAARRYEQYIDQLYEDLIGDLMGRFGITELEAERAFENEI